jgi:hypothetical protein
VSFPNTIVVAQRGAEGASGMTGAGTTTTSDYCATQVDDTTTARDVLRSLVAREASISRELVLLGNYSQRRWRCSERLEGKRGHRETFFTVVPLVRGGGADGGSTGAEDRRAMLEMYAGDKPAAVDPKELRLAKFTTCQLSQEPLRAPVVCDDLGQLYNKLALLEAMISKRIPEIAGPPVGKTVFDVELSELDDASDSIKYGCPITSIPLNGKVRFVVVRDGTSRGPRGGLSARRRSKSSRKWSWK